jgi:hypothetical protein
MIDYKDFREKKKIGTSETSDIKVKSLSQISKILNANEYPTVGNEVRVYDFYHEMYGYAIVKEYKTPFTMVLYIDDNKYKKVVYTLRKNGHWIPKGFPEFELDKRLEL